jgi:hypothetical protein
MKPTRRLPFSIVILFSLCLINLVLREFVGNRVDCMACSDPQHLAEHGGIPEGAHIHDHEDHFILAMLAAPQFRVVIHREAGAVSLPAHSRAPSPVLPPPKAA